MGEQRYLRIPFSSSYHPSGRRFCRRRRAPPSSHPSSSSPDSIFLLPPSLVLRRFASSSSLFSFLSSFLTFSSFSFPGPIGASFTCVCWKILADSVDSSQQVSDVSNTCGGGEFDGCEGRIRKFLDDTLDGVSEYIMVQNSLSACAGGEPNEG